MKRLYYWFKGVDPDRAGGPWWSREYDSYFLQDIRPFLCAYAIVDEKDHFDQYNLHPPISAKIINLDQEKTE